jgi:IS5 family transposase
MAVNGFFDFDVRLQELNEAGDPLVMLERLVDWEPFRPTLEVIRSKTPKSQGGRKPFDAVMMFKILILQSLYGLSDAQMQYQILDRLSFMKFLGLSLGDRVPDEKTIWDYREAWTNAQVIEPLFEMFGEFLHNSGYTAKKGTIIDASIVSCPKQRNPKAENDRIKKGEVPEEWDENKRRQKDTDARWTKKNNRTYFGYKNHIGVDVKDKFIRTFSVTDASVHDSQVFGELLDERNTSRDVWADAAYRSPEIKETLAEGGFRGHINEKGYRNRPLSDAAKDRNRKRSKIRARVEHVFGIQSQLAADRLLRTIGLARAKAKLGLRNLAYNIHRFTSLEKLRLQTT